MGMVVDVPLNTGIADLDETLRHLLRRELERHGFEGVDIAFDAPTRDWSGKLTNPTVDLFLYDIREAPDRAQGAGPEERANGTAVQRQPSMRVELTYAVTAWTKAVEDEHRLLSQVLSILFSHKSLPADVLAEKGPRLRGIETAVARPHEEKAEFWSAVGGQYKASIDYVVRIEVASGAAFQRGPEVRTTTIRAGLTDAPRRKDAKLHHLGGTVRGAQAEPLAHAWVAIPESGAWTAADESGRFVFHRVPAGRHRVIARSADGSETETEAEVPGARVDLVMGGKPPVRERKR